MPPKAKQLTPELADLLLETHRQGDFRKATAVLCGIHPTMLSRWLKRGLTDPEDEPYSGFAVEFMRIEAQMRLKLVNEVMVTDDLNRAKIVQWFLQHRFHQWKEHYQPGLDDGEALDVVDQLHERGGMTNDQRNQVIGDMLMNPPRELLLSLSTAGWVRPGTPQLKESNAEANEDD